MRLRFTRKPLPRGWAGISNGILLDRDIGVGHGRLKAKLLVFAKRKHLREFWRRVLGKGELGRYCCGAVNGLRMEVQNFASGHLTGSWIEADRRYFCVIGLLKGHLSMEIISHESVHAAFCYCKRRSRAPWSRQARDFDEEAVCYPAGRIAAGINRALYRAQVYG